MGLADYLERHTNSETKLSHLVIKLWQENKAPSEEKEGEEKAGESLFCAARKGPGIGSAEADCEPKIGG